MLPTRGTVVCSKAGRDCAKFFVTVATENGKLLVCDGKERPLERPKRKNLKHVSLTQKRLSEEQMLTNRSIRHVLNNFEANSVKGEI